MNIYDQEGQTGMNNVEALAATTIHSFAEQLEVQQIFLFGSYARGTYDQYSDVDLHVVTGDFAKTLARLSLIFENIGGVLLQFPIRASEGEVAYTVLFKNYPLYNKLDISILHPRARIPFSDSKSVYWRDVEPGDHHSDFVPPTFAHARHTIYNYLLGALRYTKYRKRGMHFSAYKFYKAQLESFLLTRYQQIADDLTVEKMGILEHQALDNGEEYAGLKRYLYAGNEHAMDSLYVELLQAALHDAKLHIESDDEEALTQILTFVKSELDLV